MIYQATSNVCFYSQMWQIETGIQVLDIAKLVITYIWRPFWTPSWISQNAQWCHGGIIQFLKEQGLGYKNQSRKKVWTLFPGPDKIPHKSAGLLGRYDITKCFIYSNPSKPLRLTWGMVWLEPLFFGRLRPKWLISNKMVSRCILNEIKVVCWEQCICHEKVNQC